MEMALLCGLALMIIVVSVGLSNLFARRGL